MVATRTSLRGASVLAEHRGIPVPHFVVALCLLLATQAGCASHTSTLGSESSDSAHRDTLAVIPFGWASKHDTSVRAAICEALRSGNHSYTVAIQPEAETDERLRVAGWAPTSGLWKIKRSSLYYGIHHLETDSAASLSRLSGARFVMVGVVTYYGADFSTRTDVDLDVAVYDGRSGERVWGYSDTGFRMELSSPEALRQRIGERVALRLPFARR